MDKLKEQKADCKLYMLFSCVAKTKIKSIFGILGERRTHAGALCVCVCIFIDVLFVLVIVSILIMIRLLLSLFIQLCSLRRNRSSNSCRNSSNSIGCSNTGSTSSGTICEKEWICYETLLYEIDTFSGWPIGR